MLKKIHVAKAQLGLDDDLYRQKLYEASKKTSCTQMSDRDLEMALVIFERMGFKPKRKQTNKVTAPVIHHIKQLLKQSKKPFSYAESIAQQMHNKQMRDCNVKELQAVLTAIRKHHAKNG